MKSRIIVLKFLLFVFFISINYTLQSLERDYFYNGWSITEDQEPDYYSDGFGYYVYGSHELCKGCFRLLKRYTDEVDVSAIPTLKKEQTYNWPYSKLCCHCNQKPAFYSGYLHFLHDDSFPFLNRQIAYTKKYPNIQSYWPETSTKAEKINDFAVRSLKNLFESTKLSRVWIDEELFDHFITSSLELDYWDFKESFVYKSLASSAFRFSDYYMIFKRLICYSEQFFTESEAAKIETKIDKILDDLAVQFMDLYEESMALHPTEEISQEISFVNCLMHVGGLECKAGASLQCEENPKGLSEKFLLEAKKASKIEVENEGLSSKSSPLSKGKSGVPGWFISEHFLQMGTAYNDYLLHSLAVESLNEVIRLNPNEINAYIERAHAYFELNQLDLAIQDYQKAKQLNNVLPPLMGLINSTSYHLNSKDFNGYSVSFDGEILLPKGGLDYSTGFCVGAAKGGGVSLVEFVPSTFSCCRGILHGLWSFACSPVDVSKDVINTSYVLVEYLKSHTAKETLLVVVPEMKDLLEQWDNISDYDRGEKIGYIIGKYGVDILAPGAALSGVKKFRQFKRANTMLTLECSIASQEKKAKLLNQSAKHAAARQTAANAVKSGKIIPRNPNVIPHVMQKKHEWERVVKLTGNQQEDFVVVARFLEENKVMNPKYLVKETVVPVDNPASPLRHMRYEAAVQSEVIEAIFIRNIKTSEIHLIDAWVKKS